MCRLFPTLGIRHNPKLFPVKKHHNANQPGTCKVTVLVRTLPILMASRPMRLSVQDGSIIISAVGHGAGFTNAPLGKSLSLSLFSGHGGFYPHRSTQSECIWVMGMTACFMWLGSIFQGSVIKGQRNPSNINPNPQPSLHPLNRKKF